MNVVWLYEMDNKRPERWQNALLGVWLLHQDSECIILNRFTFNFARIQKKKKFSRHFVYLSGGSWNKNQMRGIMICRCIWGDPRDDLIALPDARGHGVVPNFSDQKISHSVSPLLVRAYKHSARLGNQVLTNSKCCLCRRRCQMRANVSAHCESASTDVDSLMLQPQHTKFNGVHGNYLLFFGEQKTINRSCAEHCPFCHLRFCITSWVA